MSAITLTGHPTPYNRYSVEQALLFFDFFATDTAHIQYNNNNNSYDGRVASKIDENKKQTACDNRVPCIRVGGIIYVCGEIIR